MRLREFQGIGPTYEKKLCKNGVVTAEDLRYIDIGKIAKKTGLPPETLQRWKTQANEYKFLSDIRGIGPVSEKKLLKTGIKDYHMLQKTDIGKIARVTGIGKKKLYQWREEAQMAEGRYIIKARLAETKPNDPTKKGLGVRIKEWLKG